LSGVRVEGDGDRRHVVSPGRGDERVDDALVSAVDAVEVPEGRDARRQRVGGVGETGPTVHESEVYELAGANTTWDLVRGSLSSSMAMSRPSGARAATGSERPGSAA